MCLHFSCQNIEDHLAIGLVLGTVLPFSLLAITVTTLRMRGVYLEESFMENTSLFMLALNGLVMRYFTVNRDQDKTGRGIVMATLILALIWALKYQM